MSEINLLEARNLNNYSSLFLNGNGLISRTYTKSASDEDKTKLRGLGGDLDVIDTSLEIALLSYSAGVVDIRPTEAAEMLPQGRESSLKVGALLYQNLQVATFLRSSNAAALATVFNQFCADNAVSKAEVKTYFDRNIGTAVAAEVDAQFNRVSFLLENSRTYSSARSHNAILTRNPQNGQYILSYGGTYTNDERRTITANSLEALSSEMRNGKYKADFDETGINTVRAQAALIPAVRLSPKELGAIKDILTLFYLNPNTGTYNAVRDVHKVYSRLSVFSASDNAAYTNVNDSYVNTVGLLSLELGRKMVLDVRNDSNIASTKTVEAIAQEVSQRQ